MIRGLFASFLACACALCVRASGYEQWQSDWFKGIGSNPSASTLDPVNGTWTMPDCGITMSASGLTTDLDYATAADFAVTDGAQETNTATRLVTRISTDPTRVQDLMTPAALAANGAQFAFCVSTNETLEYRAWIGGDAWIVFDQTPVSDEAFTLTAEICYGIDGAAKSISFKVGATTLTRTIAEVATSVFPLTSTAALAANAQISHVKVYGVGSVSSLASDVQLSVATYNGQKYGEVQTAIDVAAVTIGSDDKVTVVRQTAEPVEISGSVKLDDGGKMSGSVTVPEGQTLQLEVPVAEVAKGSHEYEITNNYSVSGNILAHTSDESKNAALEIRGDKKYMVIETKPELVTAIQVAGGNLPSPSDSASLKTFLNAKIPAYKAANTSTAAISAELNSTTDQANGYTKLNNYLLFGNDTVTAASKVAAVSTGDTDASNLTLSIPSVNPPSDSGYTVTYQAWDVGNQVYVGTPATDPTQVKIPLGSGRYRVRAIIAPENP